MRSLDKLNSLILFFAVVVLGRWCQAADDPTRLESPSLAVEVDRQTGEWSLLDKAAGVRWPSEGRAKPGSAKGLEGNVTKVKVAPRLLRLVKPSGAAVVFELADEGRSLVLRYEGKDLGDIRLLGDALAVTDQDRGSVIVPCREGLFIPATSGVAFQHTFGTSDYEGCHINMIGVLKRGAALVASWDDAYVWPEVRSTLVKEGAAKQRIATTFVLRRSARLVRLTPLGKGDWNTAAAGYRRIAEQKRLAVTMRERIACDPHAELLLGAANVKLWTCLARRMNDESTKEESVKVHWTFDEAAAVAEHLRKDVGITRSLFILGGWTEGGYDCRHPDNLPANPECGGNEALAAAIGRIQRLGYVACLHDNYQDMYRDAKSWSPDFIEKKPDGSLIAGGRWLGGRAYMVCAPKQVELAMRPQNLPAIQKLFGPWSYFIDTTYAVGPRECADPKHPIDRNQDIAWKSRLSDKAREIFGLFGSECGREWALPHSDFFEGLVGVSGHSFHNLKAESLGAKVIPFWEMVYHDCQVCYGKYGYAAERAAAYVAHHVLAARPLHYHSIPDHLYWKQPHGEKPPAGPQACYLRTDQGWAAGLHPTDVFLKNTHEVLGPLNAATAHDRLTNLEFLSPDGAVRRATYGEGENATRAIVNFGPGDATVESQYGGSVLLPAYGLVIDSPKFAAFYAKRWGGKDYPDGALFTLQATEGESLSRAAKVRIFHAFGDPRIVWQGDVREVVREQVITTP
jgi:hypothetical protein